MAQNRLITDLVSLVTPNNDDVFVVVDNTTNPSLSETKKITFSNLRESLQDIVDTLITGDDTIATTYDDVSNTLTISVINNTNTQRSIYSRAGANIGTRQEVNLVPGEFVTISGEDDSENDRVNYTIATTAVSTASGLVGSGTTISVLDEVATLSGGTQSINLRALKSGSSALSLALADDDESIVVDVVASGININEVSSATPLGIARGGTGASAVGDARSNLGAAAAGANSDITSLTGLTTPLSVGQGGTDANTAANALFNLAGLRVIENAGTVGESLVEDGSINVSGEYRGRLKSLRAASSKVVVATNLTSVTVDVDSDAILSDAGANLNINGFRVTNVAAPIADSDAATKGYADSVAQGLTVKENCRLASTQNFLSTYSDDDAVISAVSTADNELTSATHPFATGDRVRVSSVGGAVPGGLESGRIYFVINVDANTFQLANTLADANSSTEINITDTGSGVITVADALFLTATGNGALQIDGEDVAEDDRILLKDQTDGTENGIYVVAATGDVSNPAILVRADDMNSSGEASAGSFAFVSEGTDNANVAFVQITQNPTLDASDLEFTRFSTNQVPEDSVTNTQLANMAAGTFKGRTLGANGDPQDLTPNEAVAIISTATDAIDCGTY